MKSATNTENKYNQNFDGVYCTCARPYPDPEGDEDDMLQCIICEDWYHLKVNMTQSYLYITIKNSIIFNAISLSI